MKKKINIKLFFYNIDFFRRLYDKKKWIFFILYGWFPVKLKTYVSEPILYDSERTVDELVSIVRRVQKFLIKKY